MTRQSIAGHGKRWGHSNNMPCNGDVAGNGHNAGDLVGDGDSGRGHGKRGGHYDAEMVVVSHARRWDMAGDMAGDGRRW